jgi:DNA-binding GntR family transcriptional regulator
MTQKNSHRARRVTSVPRDALSRGEQAYRRLREKIQHGTFKPGFRLLEVELAKTLGSSRTPVREALSRLESDGLAVRDPHRGMIVTELDHSMVGELYLVREVLEGTAARLAARHASEGEIAMLRQIVDRDREIGDDPERLANNNRVFHDALYRSAHNRYLLKTLSALRESMALLGQTTLSLHGRFQAALEEHEALVVAIERRDPMAAEQAAIVHIRAAHHSRIRLMLEREEEISENSGSNLSSFARHEAI